MKSKQAYIILFLLACFSSLQAQTYQGRVIDEQGEPIMYATVYLEQNPAVGTATNMQGVFTLQTGVHPSAQIIVSFLGYEKQELRLEQFGDSVLTIVLKEQPIALEETVIEAKAGKQRNRRKQMKDLLYKVYNRMQYDFPDEPYKCLLVSDVSMQSESQPWGMEQMVATTVNYPRSTGDERDSVLFRGEVCKRYFDARIRNRANDIYAGDDLSSDMRKAASEIDSGVVVHRALWKMGNIKGNFKEEMTDVKHWTITHESEQETVFTHMKRHNFLGMFKMTYRRHYIVDSDTYSVLRYSEEADAEVSIPFGYKVKGIYLDMLNLLNMDNKEIERFRLRRATGHARLNTIYQTIDGKKYPKEKNLQAEATLTSVKKQQLQIPINVSATQRVTSIKTHDFTPLDASQLNNRLPRENVAIY